jgi:hypothetical protein
VSGSRKGKDRVPVRMRPMAARRRAERQFQ